MIDRRGNSKDSSTAAAGASLNGLRAEFDALYADMQTRRTREAVNRLFCASAETLNRVLAERAKRRV